MINPFQLTRAADLNDEQIMRLWIDPEGELGTRLRPASQLPMIILGGKGSGKTHLMRYHSYAIQQLQHGRYNMKGRVAESGYIGIYARCSGLNASRFSRKRHTDEQWNALFAYYLDIWLGQLILQTTIEFLNDVSAFETFDESKVASELCRLFDSDPHIEVCTLETFLTHLQKLQRELDLQINNASFSHSLNPNIAITPGKLIFGIPQTLAKHIACLERVLFTILIDEYENLYEQAQRYVNTLVRERENPVTIKLGAKLYGIRTYKTFSGDEELREGSEYEMLNLDQALRDKEEAYESFARKLCVSRVRFAFDGQLPLGWTDDNAAKQFENCFQQSQPIDERVAKKCHDREESPWIVKLRIKLLQHQTKVAQLGIRDSDDISRVIQLLQFKTNLLVEKTSVFLFHRAWSRKIPLIVAAEGISKSAQSYAADRNRQTEHWRVLDKFRDDLRAQMLYELELNEFELPQFYVGLSTWIRMSDGIARNFITILKHIFDWSHFHKEDPFAYQGISLRSQVKGMQDGSNWFINDARVLGDDLGVVRSSVNRIASLLQILRFSDKPPECSLSTFSVDFDSLEKASRQCLTTAEQWSLLIRTADRSERNAKYDVIKFRINGMIAPKYNLPLYTRGSIHLSTEEATVIFHNKGESEFARITRTRRQRVEAPFVLEIEQVEENNPDELTLF